MKLKVDRRWKKETYTIGILFIDGVRFCEVLEDRDRGLKQSMTTAEIAKIKIYGETAIPTGTYKLRLNYSPKFATRTWAKKYNGCTPLLLDVPGYSGVRIHPFNTAEESLGCLGPGENKVKGKVINSTVWYYKLMDKYLMPAWNRGEDVTITIE